MSYVRWGEEGSDVYVYEHVEGLLICGCDFFVGSFGTRTVYEMVWHLERHRQAGHVVPARVFSALTRNKVAGLDEDLAARRAGVDWVRCCPVTADRSPDGRALGVVDLRGR